MTDEMNFTFQYLASKFDQTYLSYALTFVYIFVPNVSLDSKSSKIKNRKNSRYALTCILYTYISTANLDQI